MQNLPIGFYLISYDQTISERSYWKVEIPINSIAHFYISTFLTDIRIKIEKMPEKFFLFQFPSYWYDTVFTGVCRNNHWRPADFASGKPKWRKKDRWLQGFGLTKKKEKIINAVSNFTSFVFDSQTFHVTALPTAQHGQENMSCEKEKYFKFWSSRPKRFITAYKIK